MRNMYASFQRIQVMRNLQRMVCFRSSRARIWGLGASAAPKPHTFHIRGLSYLVSRRKGHGSGNSKKAL